MANSKKQIPPIREFNSFTRNKTYGNFVKIDEATFDTLENFVLANKNDVGTDAVELLTIKSHPHAGKIISAKNYVGIIAMKDGAIIEILPKITNLDDKKDEDKVKKIFLKMLKSLKENNLFKEFNETKLKIEDSNIFEIFIKMFIDEVLLLVKKGLKSSYIETDSNEYFYKGKLLISQNIKENITNRCRFFVRYDEFNANRPENKLIKTALKYLLDKTQVNSNQADIIRLLADFNGIDYSTNIDGDFSYVILSRGMERYERLLAWCKVFLKGNSFTSFSGSQVAIALLFPNGKNL